MYNKIIEARSTKLFNYPSVIIICYFLPSFLVFKYIFFIIRQCRIFSRIFGFCKVYSAEYLDWVKCIRQNIWIGQKSLFGTPLLYIRFLIIVCNIIMIIFKNYFWNLLSTYSIPAISRLEKFQVQEMYAIQNSCAYSANFKFCAGNTIFNMEGLRWSIYAPTLICRLCADNRKTLKDN